MISNTHLYFNLLLINSLLIDSNNNKLIDSALEALIKSNSFFLTLLIFLYAFILGFTLVVILALTSTLVFNILLGKYTKQKFSKSYKSYSRIVFLSLKTYLKAN